LRLNGRGVAKDIDQAETALRKAARKDYLPAIQALAEFYSHGAGSEPDLREAAVWYEKAAERGDVQAQFFMGRFYATGTGLGPNIRQAAKWFERAAENGHATAAFNVAMFYLNGSGVERNVETAIKWFERASEGGVSAAQVGLAWTLGRPGVSSLIVGARTEEQLADNLAAVEVELSQDERRRLDELSALPLLYPFWHQAASASDRLSEADLTLIAPHL